MHVYAYMLEIDIRVQCLILVVYKVGIGMAVLTAVNVI